MKEKMIVSDEIKNALQLSISLHDQLLGIIEEECAHIKDNAKYLFSDTTGREKELEKKINLSNHTVMSLFETYNKCSLNTFSKSNEEIAVQVGKLRERIHDIITVIDETIEAIKTERKNVLTQLSEIDNNKRAIHAYIHTQF